MLIILLLLTTLFLAYANGANDNFKGVATLYGSATISYKSALTLATFATFLGSFSAIYLAHGLIASFSGKGLVPQEIAGSANFLIATSLGAACTVLLATLKGFPISTTHSLVGGLLGAGIMAVGLEVNFEKLGSAFFIPLLVSPFIAFVLGAVVYGIFTRIRKILGITKESCICIGQQKQWIPISNSVLSNRISNVDYIQSTVIIAEQSECVELYTSKVCGVSMQKILDFAHILSAAAVCFARGVNDTPKIAGLLVAINIFDIHYGMIAIAISMVIGGLLNARRVAETISNKITEINHGQGLSANLVTSCLVIVASQFGIPVSTTHVSVGAIFGIGLISKKRDIKVIRSIIYSWLVTLPVAMILSAFIYLLISQSNIDF